MARFRHQHLVLLACAIASMATARGQSITVNANNNATVQPAGPRPGSNGKAFFNVEGSDNGGFASYGVADFQLPSGGPSFTTFSVDLELTQANAAFTTDGALSFFISTDTATNIEPGTSPFAFPTPAPTLSFSLGPGTFTQVSNGFVDQYIFPVTGALQTYIDSQISSGGVLRFVIEPGDPTVAATWAGFQFVPSSGPTLVLSAVPEPTSAALVIIGIAAVIASRRMNRLGKRA